MGDRQKEGAGTDPDTGGQDSGQKKGDGKGGLYMGEERRKERKGKK